jgi:membrane-bound lytic murein transglycosylase D
MLNTKLVRAGLLSIPVLSIIAVNANYSQQPADSISKTTTDTTVHWLQYDSVSIKWTGTPAATEIEAPVIGIHKQAKPFIDEYIDDNGYLLKKIKANNEPLFTIMDSVFTQQGLPVELKYLAIIESRLKTSTVSPAGAVGAWQLMPVAARMYSLKVSGKVDERRDFYKSTVAASQLLRDLHAKFGDWLLVVASYNCGPGGVLKAIKKSGSRNYWKLQQFLPLETRKHVKRFIGTHYYYEERGSVATITKDEIPAYRQLVQNYVEQHNALLKERIAKAALDTPAVKETISAPITAGGMETPE